MWVANPHRTEVIIRIMLEEPCHMRKFIPILFILLVVLLAACQSTTPTISMAPTASEVPTQKQDTAVPTKPATLAITPAAEDAPASGVVTRAKCTVESLEASLFAPVTEADWVRGPETAQVTIIEYSDFQ